MVPVISTGKMHQEISDKNADSLQAILPHLQGHEEIDDLNQLSFALSMSNSDSFFFIYSQDLCYACD
jgi:hypothetical protein